MANRTSLLLYQLSRRRRSPPLTSFFYYVPTCFVLFTSSLFIVLYITKTSNVVFFAHHQQQPSTFYLEEQQQQPPLPFEPLNLSFKANPPPFHREQEIPVVGFTESRHLEENSNSSGGGNVGIQHLGSHGINVNNEVFHDRDMFLEDYKQMNRSLKIYVYPHRPDDPFANVFLPVDFVPGGNYASESYFKKVLMQSHFITKDPTSADLFFLPFSIARMRHDPRIGVNLIQDFVRDYIFNISHKYPYWNRTGGADHFYVACHSVGRSAMQKSEEMKFNAIQVVCSSSYFLSGYISHKDASLPQIWPRQGDPPDLSSSKREKLAFFAGSVNSPVRERLLQVWGNDSEIRAHSGRLTTPYDVELLGSKFCLHVKGFEVNTARIADSLYYGCIPVIIANHYDLPFADILNWRSFSVVVATLDIPLLKKVLQGFGSEQYLALKNKVLEVRKHFQWHVPPVEYDAFYMVMYELWLRRSSLRVIATVKQ
ncbi:hypothetical protein Tsubulata_003095 [Turnera subulata]|uniref:Exostosin GT47 domain-containing protein n=1 Tax=Turnera subulata TaxID=218843 RepID=A0A9Q0G8M3_9ROSI|nr:hypothetical protein Tsubulata_003095 [Turnera subulata]